MMSGAEFFRLHFIKLGFNPVFGKAPRRFNAGKSAADNLNFAHNSSSAFLTVLHADRQQLFGFIAALFVQTGKNAALALKE